MSIINKIENLSEDTLFRGAFCGMTAGILKNFIDYILFVLEAKEAVFWHYSSILSYHKAPNGLLMHSTTLTLELTFSALLGVIFTLIAQKLKTRHFIMLGVFYGSFVWFFVKAAIVAYKITELKFETISHPLFEWILSMFFGVTLAFLERRLSPKTS